jgi:hypothetical protein
METDSDLAPLESHPSGDHREESAESESQTESDAVEEAPPGKHGKAKSPHPPRRKVRVEAAFWSALWPALEESGWTKVRRRALRVIQYSMLWNSISTRLHVRSPLSSNSLTIHSSDSGF